MSKELDSANPENGAPIVRISAIEQMDLAGRYGIGFQEVGLKYDFFRCERICRSRNASYLNTFHSLNEVEQEFAPGERRALLGKRNADSRLLAGSIFGGKPVYLRKI